MIYDIFTYNGEKDILDIRFNILAPHVDRFIIVEFDETFSGKPKPKYLLEDWNDSWLKFFDKIDYAYITKETYDKYGIIAENSPNVPQDGPKHWKREFCQKESIKDAINDLNDNDIVFIGDVDEIWDPKKIYSEPAKLKLKVYSYFLNNKSTEEFWGPIVTLYSDVKGSCLNHLRQYQLPRTKDNCGWHFTSVGGYENVKRKLTDSYTEDSYANPQVINNLNDNITANKDFLGRHFNYSRDDSDWPQYLKDNQIKYKHLLR